MNDLAKYVLQQGGAGATCQLRKLAGFQSCLVQGWYIQNEDVIIFPINDQEKKSDESKLKQNYFMVDPAAVAAECFGPTQF